MACLKITACFGDDEYATEVFESLGTNSCSFIWQNPQWQAARQPEKRCVRRAGGFLPLPVTSFGSLKFPGVPGSSLGQCGWAFRGFGSAPSWFQFWAPSGSEQWRRPWASTLRGKQGGTSWWQTGAVGKSSVGFQEIPAGLVTAHWRQLPPPERLGACYSSRGPRLV